MKPHDRFRFLQSVDTKIDQPDECWEWLGSVNGEYGKFSLGSKYIPSHRIAYELKYGEISNDMLVCHKCDNPLCCNPFHLFLGTHKDNMVDMVAKGRQQNAIGERHGRAKLTQEEAMDIKYGNKSKKELMKIYGIGITMVNYIKSGVRWSHI